MVICVVICVMIYNIQMIYIDLWWMIFVMHKHENMLLVVINSINSGSYMILVIHKHI